LEQGRYVRQLGNPIWMPEIGLGIGMEMGIYEGGVPRQWLYWYDEQGQKLPVPENVIVMERQRAEQERLRAEREQVKAEQERIRAEQAEQQIQDLMARLRSRGIDPDQL
jgi:hypothetical protein